MLFWRPFACARVATKNSTVSGRNIVVVIETRVQQETHRLSLTASVCGGACNLLSWIFLNYQNYIVSHDAGLLHTIYLAAFDGCFFLTPLLVLIIFRRVALITISYALALLIVLIGRVYYLALLNFVGVSAVVRPFDVSCMLLIALSAISVVVILMWVGVRLITLIVDVMTRRWGA
jgi:hypothetical protein